MSRPREDLTGQRYGRLLVTECVGQLGTGRAYYYKCICDCGNVVEKVRADALKQEKTISCKCYSRTLKRKYTKPEYNIGNTSHGMNRTKEHQAWKHIKTRCFNKNCEDYKDYGERGITMEESWIDSFEEFYKEVGSCPLPHTEYSIHRKNNDKGYIKGNVEWTDKFTQARNRINNHLITYNGITKTLMEWANETGIHRLCISRRLKRGWTVEKALTTKKKESIKEN